MIKIDILKQVCDYTGYAITIKNEKIICENVWGYDTKYTYNNIDDALIDWLPTFIEQEEGCGEDLYENGNENGMWRKEIEFIKNLKESRR